MTTTHHKDAYKDTRDDSRDDGGDPNGDTDHAVVVGGGGPTGMMTAAELALAGVDVAVVERRTTPEITGSRAGGLLSRTLEILDQRGVVDRFLSAGETMQVHGFAQVRLDVSDLPTRHPYGLALWQKHIERILAEWVDELAVPVYRGREVVGVRQDGAGVDIELSDGRVLRAGYLVGCDGGRSLIRKSAGIEFPGWEPTTSYLLAEVEIAPEDGREPEWGIRRDALGVHALSRSDDGPVRIMVTEQDLRRSGVPDLAELREALVTVYGTDFGIHSPTSISRFTDTARQAVAYRSGRILLVGDAAHVHHPVGGQGLNTGMQDAVNLGWKLAQVVQGWSPDTLLDTYHDERHPVGARVLRNAVAQMALLRPDDRTTVLHGVVSDMLDMDEPRRRFAAMMSGLDIHYDLGDGHPLLGLRMPDLDLETAHGPTRVSALLRQARPVLLDLGAPDAVDLTGWEARVRMVRANAATVWELPVIGEVPAPAAVLIRPDGHVAWVAGDSAAAPAEAAARWFGAPTGRR